MSSIESNNENCWNIQKKNDSSRFLTKFRHYRDLIIHNDFTKLALSLYKPDSSARQQTVLPCVVNDKDTHLMCLLIYAFKIRFFLFSLLRRRNCQHANVGSSKCVFCSLQRVSCHFSFVLFCIRIKIEKKLILFCLC